MWDPKLQIPEEFRNLEPIWRKLNKASLDQTAMRRENRALMAENSQLQAAMKNYLDRSVDDVDPAKNVFSHHISVSIMTLMIIFNKILA